MKNPISRSVNLPPSRFFAMISRRVTRARFGKPVSCAFADSNRIATPYNGPMNVMKVRYSATNAARELTQSILETGFAVLTDHPVPANLIADTYAEWAAFFASSEKLKHTFETAVQAGYFPFRSENAKDSPVKDLKEFYHHYPVRKPLPPGVDRHTPKLRERL